MNVILPIPDDLAERFGADNGDISRRALEAVVAEAYRAGRLSHPDLRRLLGFATHAELDAFLKQRQIYEDFDVDDLNAQRAGAKRLGI